MADAFTMADQGNRTLLPQNTTSFVPMAPERREKQTNYVFVDEHNRSRRLKVMRACESCRRRKIKCDAASTNVWPCTACMKQKIPCAPPTLNLEKDDFIDPSGPEQQTFKMEQASSPDSNFDFNTYQSQGHGASSGPTQWKLADSFYPSHETYQTPPRSDLGSGFEQRSQYGSVNTAATTPRPHLRTPMSFDSPSAPSEQSLPQSVGWRSDLDDSNISDALGDLKITNSAAAPYITNQRNLADSAAVHDPETPVPLTYGPDNKVIIPPEMMPDEKQARVYFEYFFKNIHPYVPVLSRSLFFQKWQTDRQSISPLILEGIFACSAMLMQHVTEGSRWLSLAARHEDSFGDVPRLSTLQGLIILLKARETVPKRGYYYRSWMTIVKLIAMAKDLELDQHLELHQAGRDCGSNSLAECTAKTRIWQNLFVVELMVGGSQGRTDFSIHPYTVDTQSPRAPLGLEDSEFRISQQFTHLAFLIRNIRRSSEIYAQLRNKKEDWALDDDFVQHNQDFNDWLQNLPPHLRISFPADSSPPWLPSHFVANLHSYYYLAILMHHRPQLHSSDPTNESWRTQFLICYSAATRACLLQEAILQQYGLDGLLWMQRGANFAIYLVLTSIVLHLVALTSPDPAVSYDAADYFSRHMRILERLSSSWPMPQMQAQILSLRQAFSADIMKPFELRPDFPPSSSRHTTPSESGSGNPPGNDYTSHGSPSYYTQHEESPAPLDRVLSSGQSATSMSLMQHNLEYGTVGGGSYGASQHTEYWNPSKIFDQWNVAFGQNAQSDDAQSPVQTTQMPALQRTTSGNTPSQFTQNVTHVTNVQFNSNNNMAATTSPGSSISNWPTSSYFQPSDLSQGPSFFSQQIGQQAVQPPLQQTSSASHASMPSQSTSITPNMWQDAVASSYGAGSKRRFNDSVGDASMMGHFKRSR